MTDDEQLDRFGQAVEKKNEEAKARSEQAGEQNPSGAHIDGDQPELTEHGRDQDVQDERAKGSRHGHVTADKWNQ